MQSGFCEWEATPAGEQPWFLRLKLRESPAFAAWRRSPARDMRRRSAAAALMGAALLLASCVSTHPPMPAGWNLPAAESGGRCPDLTGTYYNVEEHGEGKPGLRLMLRWHENQDDFPLPLAQWLDVDRVALRHEGEDALRVTGLAAGRPLFEKVLRKSAGDFACAGGWLQVKGTRLQSSSSAFVHTREQRGFARAGNDLLEKTEGESFGMMLILPVGGSFTEWHRYAAAAE